MDTSTLFSAVTTAFGSFGKMFLGAIFSWVIIVLDCIILAKLETPLFGLRCIPVYGQYFFFKNIIPEKRGLSITYIILNIISFMLMVVSLITGFITLLSGITNNGESFLANLGITSIILFAVTLILGIVSFIMRIILYTKMAPKFGYGSGLGVIFGIIPLIGSICMLINAGQFSGDDDYIYEDNANIYNNNTYNNNTYNDDAYDE